VIAAAVFIAFMAADLGAVLGALYWLSRQRRRADTTDLGLHRPYHYR
jgi:hypothetical protein